MSDTEKLPYGTVVGYGDEIVRPHFVLKDAAELLESIVEALDLVVLQSPGGYGTAPTYKIVTQAQARLMLADREKWS